MISTLPTLILALLIALLCGALYHFARGGSGWKLLYYFGASALGFAAGQEISIWRGWVVFQFGALDVGLGAIGSFVFLALGEWLSRFEAINKSGL